jgi:hypothetical protein
MAAARLRWTILQISSSRSSPLKGEDLYLYLQQVKRHNGNSLLQARNHKTDSSINSSRSAPNRARSKDKYQPQCHGT